MRRLYPKRHFWRACWRSRVRVDRRLLRGRVLHLESAQSCVCCCVSAGLSRASWSSALERTVPPVRDVPLKVRFFTPVGGGRAARGLAARSVAREPLCAAAGWVGARSQLPSHAPPRTGAAPLAGPPSPPIFPKLLPARASGLEKAARERGRGRRRAGSQQVCYLPPGTDRPCARPSPSTRRRGRAARARPLPRLPALREALPVGPSGAGGDAHAARHAGLPAADDARAGRAAAVGLPPV